MESIDFKTTLNISAAGSGCQMRLGDIDGDGRLEIVMIKPDTVSDDRYFSNQATAITAFSADGELLWQLGDVNIESSAVSSDLPVQIYDIDKDGKNEVIAIINGSLLILDGKTSEVKKQTPLPDKYACDCIVIADLEGTGYAQNILLKNKFSTLWALDSNLNVLWDFHGNIGHTPVAYDINGDGCEEIIAGYNVISASGELLWKADMPHHATSVAVDCLYNENEPVIIICGPKMQAYTPYGELLWELAECANNIAIGDFCEHTQCNDILILDSMSLFDANGGFLYQKNEVIYNPIPVPNLDDSGKNYIAGHKKEDICTTIYDGYMRACYTIPTFGNIAWADLTGDGISQILIYNDEVVDIYSYKETDLKEPARPYPRQQPKQFYNVSNRNTLPLSQITQKYVVDDFASQNILKWADTYASLNIHNNYAKVVRSEFVLLLASLLNLKEEFTENFADVPKESSFYEAVGTFRELQILNSNDNLFMPDQPITVADANIILENLSIPLKFNFDDRYEISKQDMARLVLNLNSAG